MPTVAHICPRPLAVWFTSFVSRKDVRSQSLREARSMMIESESFPANGSSAGISTGSSEDGEQNAHPTSSCLTEGFTIQTKTHVLGCDCDVCTKLWQITKSTCALVDQTVSPKEIIFVGYDGGFVVGKRQQKHHVLGCHCPNCNNYRRRCDTGESVCVKISIDLLHDMVGEARCGQVVFTAATEMQRRAKIGAANKGKCAWNKGKRHSMETIAKIKANTAKAMKNPKVKQRMKEAAARTFHSETTKFKIRRTVRDKANKKMQARNIVRARELGVRKGKVGVCSISMHARRVSSVQLVSYGAWTRDSLDHHDRILKLRSKRNKQLAEDAKKQARNTSEEGLPPPQKPARGTRGMPKSSQHKAAISAALKAKWSDPSYVASQKRATRVRTSNHAAPSEKNTQTTADNDMKMTDQRRAVLVRELQETYTKALMAVKTFEERKAAGLEVDELMLKKALSAVAQTGKMLASVGLRKTHGKTKAGRNNQDVTA